jgi:hypothetical protein
MKMPQGEWIRQSNFFLSYGLYFPSIQNLWNKTKLSYVQPQFSLSVAMPTTNEICIWHAESRLEGGE